MRKNACTGQCGVEASRSQPAGSSQLSPCQCSTGLIPSGASTEVLPAAVSVNGAQPIIAGSMGQFNVRFAQPGNIANIFHAAIPADIEIGPTIVVVIEEEAREGLLLLIHTREMADIGELPRGHWRVIGAGGAIVAQEDIRTIHTG